MIMGNICTRNCRFCAVDKGKPLPVDEEEPRRIAEAARKLNLRHVVVTCVTRDDLEDGGASHFEKTINELKKIPGLTVEVLVYKKIGYEMGFKYVASGPLVRSSYNAEKGINYLKN